MISPANACLLALATFQLAQIGRFRLNRLKEPVMDAVEHRACEVADIIITESWANVGDVAALTRCANDEGRSILGPSQRRLSGWSKGPHHAMHYAAGWGGEEAVRFLAVAGAEVDCVDGDGNTPLMWAARFSQVATARVLLALGADVLAENRQRKKAIDLCRADLGATAKQLVIGLKICDDGSASAKVHRNDMMPDALTPKCLAARCEEVFDIIWRHFSAQAEGGGRGTIAGIQNREIDELDYEVLLRLDDSVERSFNVSHAKHAIWLLPRLTVSSTITTGMRTEKKDGTSLVVSDQREEIGDGCRICLEDWEEDQVVSRLPCGHCLHTRCLDDYALAHQFTTCPVDRQPFAS